ncbi:MAG: cysteine dioxygenase family protein [Tepidisphaeraceae bacterium]
MRTDTNITLAELFTELDRYDHRVPLDVLEDRLKSLDVDWSRIEPSVRFAPDTYRRNLIRAGRAYHALILCWRPGQRSPIHDHRGSSCGVRVLRGTCTETLFDRTASGHIFPTDTHPLPPGHCCGSQDADIHQISNLAEDGADLITLHIYSPPLMVMGQYSLTSATRAEFKEPVREFTEGAGI